MAGSDAGRSQGSDSSHASSYHSVRIRERTRRDGREEVSIRESSARVPQDAPSPRHGAEAHMYDAERGRWLAVDTSAGRAGRVWQAVQNRATGAWDWVKHHKGPLTKAVVDFTPVALQTAADSMDGGPVKKGVQAAAAFSGAYVGARDMWDEGRKIVNNDPVNPARVLAGASRLTSASLAASNTLNPGSVDPRIAGYVSGFATALDATDSVHRNPPPEQTPEQRMYRLGHQANLGNQPGDMPAGWESPSSGHQGSDPNPSVIETQDFRGGRSAPRNNAGRGGYDSQDEVDITSAHRGGGYSSGSEDGLDSSNVAYLASRVARVNFTNFDRVAGWESDRSVDNPVSDHSFVSAGPGNRGESSHHERSHHERGRHESHHKSGKKRKSKG